MKKFLQTVAAPKVLEKVGVSWECAFQVSGLHTLTIKECQLFESGWGQISSQHPAPCFSQALQPSWTRKKSSN